MYLCPFEDVGRGPIMSHITDGVLESYPLEFEELAGVGYAFGMIAPSSQHLAYIILAKKTALSPSQEYCEFPDDLYV